MKTITKLIMILCIWFGIVGVVIVSFYLLSSSHPVYIGSVYLYQNTTNNTTLYKIENKNVSDCIWNILKTSNYINASIVLTNENCLSDGLNVTCKVYATNVTGEATKCK